ncbi:hypothetical protein SOVF_107350 [Spinacia oleracea]|nr:hypothetical protein SOVF_107350 [Spinacia oleracea]
MGLGKENEGETSRSSERKKGIFRPNHVTKKDTYLLN